MVVLVKENQPGEFVTYLGENGEFKEANQVCGTFSLYRIPLNDGTVVDCEMPNWKHMTAVCVKRYDGSLSKVSGFIPNYSARRNNLEQLLSALKLECELDYYSGAMKEGKYIYIVDRGLGWGSDKCVYVECSEQFAKHNTDSSNYIEKKSEDFFHGEFSGMTEEEKTRFMPLFLSSFIKRHFDCGSIKKISGAHATKHLREAFGWDSKGRAANLRPLTEELQILAVQSFIIYLIKNFSSIKSFKSWEM